MTSGRWPDLRLTIVGEVELQALGGERFNMLLYP